MTDEELHEVVLQDVPVAVWVEAQEQTDALLREFDLIAGGGAPAHEVPRRLTELVAHLDTRFAGQTSAQEEQLFAAAEAGMEVLAELRYVVPAAAGMAARALGELLEEADAFCAQGEHLLTLAASERVVQLRAWWLAQFEDQIAGRPPVRWADFRR